MNISQHLLTLDPKIAVAVFFAALLIDAMYAYYTLAVTKRQPFTAATVGSLMYLLVAFGVLSYVENYLYVLPMVIGSWIGTYLIIARDIRANGN